MTDERTRRIQELAHSFWEQEGRPHGRDAQHWSEAERQIDAADEARVSPSAEPTAVRRQSKPKVATKKRADTSSESSTDNTDAGTEVKVKEPVKTGGRKPKAAKDGAEAPKTIRGRKTKSMGGEKSGI